MQLWTSNHPNRWLNRAVLTATFIGGLAGAIYLVDLATNVVSFIW